MGDFIGSMAERLFDVSGRPGENPEYRENFD
jgi:hypothetical protein